MLTNNKPPSIEELLNMNAQFAEFEEQSAVGLPLRSERRTLNLND